MPTYEYRVDGEYYSVWETTDDNVVWQAYHSKYAPKHPEKHAQKIVALNTPSGGRVVLAQRIDNTFVEVYNSANGIIEFVQDGYCARCLVSDNVFFDIYGYLCTRCLSSLGTCTKCNKGHWVHRYNNIWLCEECYKERQRVCYNCSGVVLEKDAHYYRKWVFCSEECAIQTKERRERNILNKEGIISE